ncbi:MAG: hypothetical protein JNL67_03650 [Planctomycetaceae bacterium]|nr:hypothetical protein [Planctomycetaceae bacterium]
MSRNVCQNWEAFHDHELGAADQAEFAAHLPSCLGCQTRLCQLEQLDADVMAAWCLFGGEATDASNVQRVDMFNSAHRGRLWRRRWATYLGLGTALAGIGLFLWWGSQFGSDLPQTQSTARTVPQPEELLGADSTPREMIDAVPIPEVQIAFTEGTDGIKVLTRPSFSYVHVFPTVRRLPNPQN